MIAKVSSFQRGAATGSPGHQWKKIFPQNSGKSFLGILAKNRTQNKCFSWFSRHFKTSRVDSVPPPNTNRIKGHDYSCIENLSLSNFSCSDVNLLFPQSKGILMSKIFLVVNLYIRVTGCIALVSCGPYYFVCRFWEEMYPWGSFCTFSLFFCTISLMGLRTYRNFILYRKWNFLKRNPKNRVTPKLIFLLSSSCKT